VLPSDVTASPAWLMPAANVAALLSVVPATNSTSFGNPSDAATSGAIQPVTPPTGRTSGSRGGTIGNACSQAGH